MLYILFDPYTLAKFSIKFKFNYSIIWNSYLLLAVRQGIRKQSLRQTLLRSPVDLVKEISFKTLKILIHLFQDIKIFSFIKVSLNSFRYTFNKPEQSSTLSNDSSQIATKNSGSILSPDLNASGTLLVCCIFD